MSLKYTLSGSLDSIEIAGGMMIIINRFTCCSNKLITTCIDCVIGQWFTSFMDMLTFKVLNFYESFGLGFLYLKFSSDISTLYMRKKLYVVGGSKTSNFKAI